MPPRLSRTQHPRNADAFGCTGNPAEHPSAPKHISAAPVFSPRILPPRPIPLPRPPSAGMRIRNIDKKASLCYNTERADKSALARRSHNTDGIWCNGNTRDFDSRFAGSSPAIPAINPSGGKTGDFERFLPFFRP